MIVSQLVGLHLVALLTIGRIDDWAGNLIPHILLLCRLWLQLTSPEQDGTVGVSEDKHPSLQSMVVNQSIGPVMGKAVLFSVLNQ